MKNDIKMPRRNKISKRVRYQQNNSCQTKRQYLTEQQAKKSAEYQMLINYELNLSVYKCEYCCKWHLTKNR